MNTLKSKGNYLHSHAMPPNGHALERFTVAGIKFEFSDFIINSGFHKTQSHGGPIHNGLQVRISYVGNTIVKLETKDGDDFGCRNGTRSSGDAN